MSSSSSNSSSSSRDPRQFLSCLDATNSLFWCASPGHQLDRYWKDGEVDACLRPLNELKTCMRLKFAGADEAREIVRSLVKEAAKPAPTMGIVWEPRQPR